MATDVIYRDPVLSLSVNDEDETPLFILRSEEDGTVYANESRMEAVVDAFLEYKMKKAVQA